MRAPVGTTTTVKSFTPSRIGIITSRRVKLNEEVTGVNFAGISFGRVAAVCACSNGASKRIKAIRESAIPAVRIAWTRAKVVRGNRQSQSFAPLLVQPLRIRPE